MVRLRCWREREEHTCVVSETGGKRKQVESSIVTSGLYINRLHYSVIFSMLYWETIIYKVVIITIVHSLVMSILLLNLSKLGHRYYQYDEDEV